MAEKVKLLYTLADRRYREKDCVDLKEGKKLFKAYYRNKNIVDCSLVVDGEFIAEFDKTV